MVLHINFICVLLSSIIFPVLPAQQANPPPRILSIAKQIVRLPKLHEYGYYYQWQTEHRILVWKDDPNDFHPVLIDSRSGTQNDLKAFNTRLTQIRRTRGRILYAYTMRLSPDGKWVVWMERGLRWVALSLDGIHAVSSDNGPGLATGGIPELVWMPDSRHFTALTDYSGYTLHIYSLDAPSHPQERQLPPFPSEWIPKVNFFLRLIGFPSAGRALCDLIGDDEQGIPNTDFYNVPIDGKTADSRHYTIPIPKEVRINGIDALELSPQGDRLVWCYRYLHYFNNGYSNRQEIWVSDVDGSHVHEIGFHEMTRIEGQQAMSDILIALQWTPDGKRLSFLYKDALWTVPAD